MRLVDLIVFGFIVIVAALTFRGCQLDIGSLVLKHGESQEVNYGPTNSSKAR